jgi:hypothetical protein
MTLQQTADREILKQLGEQVAKIAGSPSMTERKRLWKRLNALDAERSMILIETCGILDEVVPISSLQCLGDIERQIERQLRERIFHEGIGDDQVFEARITQPYLVETGDCGYHVEKHQAESDRGIGSYHWDPPIVDIEEGITRLHHRTLSIDRTGTDERCDFLESIFQGVLAVVKRGMYWWSMGLTIEAIDLIGMEGLMLAPYDQPEGLHALMAFLRDDAMMRLDWYEAQGILLPNNQDDYIGSGGCGYTDELPLSPHGPPYTVRDMWGLSESQETVGWSPDSFAEFIFPYQAPVISRFGFACYGCCEPVDQRWDVIRSLPNLRRVSVSPWSDQQVMARNLQRNYVYNRKPNPAHVSMDAWDEGLLVSEFEKTKAAAGGLNLELVLKDVHTVARQPWRLKRWTDLAKRTLWNND